MKNLKRLLCMLLALVLCVGSLAACGANSENNSNDPNAGEQEIDGPVTIDILTQRHDGTTTDANDLWFFKYMELWFAEQGYDVTINVQQTNEAGTQVSLLLGTDSLPDLVWGIPLTRTNVVQYGIEDGMILDWSAYINEDTMPNLTARLAEDSDIYNGSVAPDDGMYALPYITPSIAGSGCYGTSERLYFRQSWLDAVGMENPTTMDELLAVLRAFKKHADSNGGGYALVSDANFLEKYVWTCLGYYGTEPNKYGYNLMLKDGQLVMPCYTEDYKTFISFMNTLYSEGLISTDYFSMDSTTAQGLMRDNKCGAMCYWTLEPAGNDFADIVCANPILFGDNDTIHVSRLATYTANTVWASSDTEYPALLAMLVDFIYSDEGAMLYRYGPKQGEDPLGLVDGWYYDENGDITTDLVADGTYATMTAYGRDRLFPYDSAGLRPTVVSSGSGEYFTYTDSVTGEEYQVIDNLLLDPETNDGHWRLITIEKWSDCATSVRLPGAYLSSEDNQTCADIITTIQTYVTDESAKFITGKRPISEIEDFWASMKTLGIEEYLEINNTVYAEYLQEIGG